ncbi:MAG: methyltransferase domain-containing protein [Limisphaerales bacterium]
MLATRDYFFDLARNLARQGSIPARNHGYFEQHRDRLWKTIYRFNLLETRCDHVLDIGPYFAYTPFLWKEKVATRVTIFEGDSPESAVLLPLYKARNIDVTYGDLLHTFDELSPAEKKLPYADNTFDRICCWEMMEHFNFNPVPFVRELHRVLKPGGHAHVTVPNMAKLDRRLALLCGRTVGTPVDEYQSSAGTKSYSFHWREYTLAEITELFRNNSFTIELSTHLQTFQNRPLASFGALKRTLAGAVIAVVPGFSALCLVKARK